MGKIFFKAMVCVLLISIFSSCSKDTYSENDDSSSTNKEVIWDANNYSISYVRANPVLNGSPSYDSSMDFDISLDDSENPSRYISVYLTNYKYGEKLDLSTDKNDSHFMIVDKISKDKVDLNIYGGDNRIQNGSYLILNRTNDKIFVDMVLSYVDNGFTHTIKIHYNGGAINMDDFPSLNYLEEIRENYTYKFNYDEASCDYSDWPLFEKYDNFARFSADLFGQLDRFSVEVENFEWDKQQPISFARILYKDENEYEEFRKDQILDGSYIQVKQNANKYKDIDVIIKLQCKSADGKVHKFDVEYKGYLRLIQ